MSNNPIQDASFVVRIWWEQTGQDDFSWRGQVIHAQTSQSKYFDSIPALIGFLERWVGELLPIQVLKK
ncbi:MAG: hypothetical protein KJ638_10810 [Chloroflexi bacterium]|nr:hypothetical protein [Chloroflexota bacterium]